MNAYFARIQKDFDENSNLCTKSRATVASLEDVHGKIEGLISDVRARAAELFQVDPAATVCPICGAVYEKGELLDRVQHEVTHKAVPELHNAHSELARLESKEEKLSKVLRELVILQAVAKDVLGLTKPGEESVKSLIASVLVIDRFIVQTEQDLDRFERDRKSFQAKSFTEQEYTMLSVQLSKLSEDMFSPTDSSVANEHKKVVKEIESAKNRKSALSKVIEKASHRKQKLLSEHFGFDNGNINTLKSRIFHLAEVKQRVDTICEDIVVERDQPLSDLGISINLLKKSVESFVQIKQKDESVKHVIKENEAKIRNAKYSIKNDSPVRDRLKHAVAVLEMLTTEHGQDKYVQEFFSKNLRQISDLFCVMHAPRDFEEVVWEVNNPMAIRAVRKCDSAVCTVSNLSSGQRNALSLAIFLTMNLRIQDAPKLILLDDPVAHVDDLNIISFFDCLREMLSGHRRQVFFATANYKTANLFQKKFDFLGNDEFKSFQLSQ